MPVRGILDEAKAGIELVRAGRFHAPPASSWLRRVLYAPGLFVALAKAILRDPGMRRRYLRILLPQAILTVVVGVAFVVTSEGVGNFNFHYDGKNFTRVVEKNVRSTAALLVQLYGALAIVEWIVVALTRQFHDALSFEVSRLVGVPPEEEVPDPRVKLDVDWLVTKMKRRIQGGIILIVTVLPLLALYAAVVSPLVYAIVKGSVVSSWVQPALNAIPNAVVPLVGAYWLGVFTLGKTAHAWRDETVPDPAYLRFMDAASSRFPRACAPLHLYARVLRRFVGLVRRPAFLVERAPWETMGLVLVRIVISLPGLYILMRPLIPVASTIVIAARSPDTLRGLPLSLVLEERTQ